MSIRFLPIGPRSLLAELADLDATLALFRALSDDPVPGVAEIVPAARTLMIRTRPGTAADARLAGQISSRQRPAGTRPATVAAEAVEVPVRYDGADLAEIARLMDCSEAELVAAHQAATWQVAFCGFAPGFAYMTCDDPGFDLPRRAEPRTRIPAGSVALAGRFCGVYPQETPGGWQLLGRTDMPMWDLARNPPALLSPGMACRFVARHGAVHPVAAVEPRQVEPPQGPGLEVVSSAFPILFQDEGRPGLAGQGVSASGALDIGALRRANRAVGNPAGQAALEIGPGPVRLRAGVAMLLALAGAAQARVAGQAIPRGAAFAVDAGDEIAIAAPEAGMRSYLALRGGFLVAPVLGSAATDLLAGIGPPAIVAGRVLHPAGGPALAAADHLPEHALPAPGDVVALAVTLGPRADWFGAAALEDFLAQDWLVTPQVSRVGLRMEGARPLLREHPAELPSEGTETGAVQVPHSGQPVLFLADHPLTGGYPVIATLRPEALDLAGQIPPGARIRFVADADFAPIIPKACS